MNAVLPSNTVLLAHCLTIVLCEYGFIIHDSQVMSCINESCHISETSHVPHTNAAMEGCFLHNSSTVCCANKVQYSLLTSNVMYKRVMSHMDEAIEGCLSHNAAHVCPANTGSVALFLCDSYINESCHIWMMQWRGVSYKCLTSAANIGFIAALFLCGLRINGPCRIWMRQRRDVPYAMPHTWVLQIYPRRLHTFDVSHWNNGINTMPHTWVLQI